MTLEDDIKRVDETIKKVRLRYADWFWFAGILLTVTTSVIVPCFYWISSEVLKIHDHMLLTNAGMIAIKDQLGEVRDRVGKVESALGLPAVTKR